MHDEVRLLNKEIGDCCGGCIEVTLKIYYPALSDSGFTMGELDDMNDELFLENLPKILGIKDKSDANPLIMVTKSGSEVRLSDVKRLFN